MRTAVIIGFTLLASGCFSGRPLPGAYSCKDASSPCPVNYVCVNQLCVAPDGGVAGGGGGGGIAGGGGGGMLADVGAPCVSNGDCLTATCDPTSKTCELASGPPFWLPISNMALTHQRPAVLLLADGSIMAAGGASSVGGTLNKFNTSVEVYLPSSSKWQDISGNTTAPFGNMVYSNQAAVAGQFTTKMDASGLYVAGGGGNETTLQMYDPATKMFTSVTNTTGEFIDQAGSAMFDGKLYIFGGYSAANVIGGKSERFDPTTGWSNLGLLNTARRALAGALGADGTLYALGGHGDSGNDTTLATVEVFVPNMASWAPATPLPQPREDLAAASGPDGRLYVMGGLSGAQTLNTVVAFTPSRTHWTAVSPMTSFRSGLGGVTGADGILYAIGGADVTGTPINSAEAYGPKLAVVSNALQGTNFAATAAVTLYDSPTPSGTVVGTGTTDAKGALLAPIPLRSLASGSTHTLTVMDNHSRFPVQITATIP